jgi:hypothetical protein
VDLLLAEQARRTCDYERLLRSGPKTIQFLVEVWGLSLPEQEEDESHEELVRGLIYDYCSVPETEF